MQSDAHPGMESRAAALLDEAVGEVLLTMLQLACNPGGPAGPMVCPISALVTFAGTMRGRCVVRVGTGCAAWLTTLLIGDPSEPGVELINDTVGELCNMIAGGYKNRLGAVHGGCTLSVPRIGAVEEIAKTDGEVLRVDRVYPLGEGDMMVSLSVDAVR